MLAQPLTFVLAYAGRAERPWIAATEADVGAPNVTKRLANTGQTFPFLRGMLRQILSRGL